MGRGRPRKSKAIHDLNGNPGKRSAPEDMPLTGLPECPSTIDAVAAGHFERVVAELAGLGAVKKLDTEALSVLGEVWSDFWRAAEQLRAAEIAQDIDAAKEARMLKYQAYKAWSSLAAKFYLTPVDRLRIMAAGKEPKPNPVKERFLKIRA